MEPSNTPSETPATPTPTTETSEAVAMRAEIELNTKSDLAKLMESIGR